MTTTEKLTQRIIRIEPGKSIVLRELDATYSMLQSWRHASRKLGIPISIKTTPEGVRLWRTK